MCAWLALVLFGLIDVKQLCRLCLAPAPLLHHMFLLPVHPFIKLVQPILHRGSTSRRFQTKPRSNHLARAGATIVLSPAPVASLEQSPTGSGWKRLDKVGSEGAERHLLDVIIYV